MLFREFIVENKIVGVLGRFLRNPKTLYTIFWICRTQKVQMTQFQRINIYTDTRLASSGIATGRKRGHFPNNKSHECSCPVRRSVRRESLHGNGSKDEALYIDIDRNPTWPAMDHGPTLEYTSPLFVWVHLYHLKAVIIGEHFQHDITCWPYRGCQTVCALVLWALIHSELGVLRVLSTSVGGAKV